MQSMKKVCVKCEKGAGTAVCSGCQQPYCVTHFMQHRNELKEEMNTINKQHASLQDDLLSETAEHPYLTCINRWEMKSITQIQVAAEAARADFQELFDRTKADLKRSIETVTAAIQLSCEEEDYTELDLKNWSKKIKELRLLYEKPLNIDIDNLCENSSESLINLINIKTQSNQPNLVLPVLQSNSRRSEQSNTSRPTPERFGTVYGIVGLTEGGTIARNNDDNYSKLCGTNQYSIGVHQIRFRAEEQMTPWNFIGIISRAESISLGKVILLSANGWGSDLNQVVTNGRSVKAQTSDKTIQPGDEVTLILDCDNRKIRLEHHRTKRIVHQTIDTKLSPLPWMIFVVLPPCVGYVRIVGSL